MSYLYVIGAGIGGVCLFSGYKIYNLYKTYKNISAMLVHDMNYKNSIILYQHYAEIPYYHNGISYSIRVPYKRSEMARMDEFIVWADEKNITQQPGIPYLLDAEELGCKEITSCNVDTEETFSYNGAPMYL